MSYPERFLKETIKIAETVDLKQVEKMIDIIRGTQESNGRIFFIGVGGSAANCTHAVNDFRKLAGIECYAPVDNVAELTARTNDEGWETVFSTWLGVSRLRSNDVIFVLSVGGGSAEKNISVNIVNAVKFAKKTGAKIIGILGRDGGFTAQNADACVIIPTQSPDTITPHAEGWQGVIWHMLVSDPRVLKAANKWESVSTK